MNERIKLLADQAKDWAYADHDGYTAQMLFEQKFAELIVRECGKQIQQQVSLKYKDSDSYDVQNEEWVMGHYAGSLLSRVVIAQHFGVGE
jgi:hypothetical protein